jgi:hypothetical protein
MEADMLAFFKDMMALMVLCGFSAGALAWMDMLTRFG